MDWRRRAVGVSRRAQPEAVLYRHTQSGQQRTRKAAKALSGRNRPVAVMKVFGDTLRVAIGGVPSGELANIVMRTDSDQVVGVGEEALHGLDLGAAGRLPRS